MNAFIDSKYEVNYIILELLTTINEALFHMEKQFEELRIEESSVLFKDTIEAIGSIVYCLATNTDVLDNHDNLVKNISDINNAISLMNDAYEQNNLSDLQTSLKDKLIPLFILWQEEVEKVLRTTISS